VATRSVKAAIGRSDRHRLAVAGVSKDAHHRDVHHPSDLFGNGREDLIRRRARRRERRDAP